VGLWAFAQQGGHGDDLVADQCPEGDTDHGIQSHHTEAGRDRLPELRAHGDLAITLRQEAIVKARHDQAARNADDGEAKLPPDRTRQHVSNLLAGSGQRPAVDQQQAVGRKAQRCEQQDEVKRSRIAPADHGAALCATLSSLK
jgi:hypothetical protein